MYATLGNNTCSKTFQTNFLGTVAVEYQVQATNLSLSSLFTFTGGKNSYTAAKRKLVYLPWSEILVLDKPLCIKQVNNRTVTVVSLE